MHFVYITTNLINGKKYLGKHNGKNKNYLGSGTLLKKAIEKYGRENFSIQIVQECSTEEETYELEKKLSLKFNVVESVEWYNMKVGGEGFSSGKFHPMFGVPKSEQHKIKLSKANIGKKLSDETKQKISLRFRGSNNPCFGLKVQNHPAYGHKKSEICKKIYQKKSKVELNLKKNY